MKDTSSSKAATPMTLKKRDDQASRDFWDYVEKSKRDWQAQQPSWSRELEQRQERTAIEHPVDDRKPLACKS